MAVECGAAASRLAWIGDVSHRSISHRQPVSTHNQHTPLRSRGTVVPGLIISIAPQREGAGKTGRLPTPAAPVREEVHGAGTTGSAGTSRPSLRNGLRLIRGLPGAPGLLVTITRAMREHCHALDTGIGVSGHHDFTVRKPPVVYWRLTAIAPRTQRIVTTRTPLFDEAG